VITSRHNETLKLVRKLGERRWRDKLGLFVAEGEDLVAAAEAAGAAVSCLSLPGLSLDVDTPTQLAALRAQARPGSAVRRLLARLG
jgi:hypothetical protein